jgi:hypothetical protein|tara:strand:- start:1357 stop:1650 length:294 start_codon:yes stop_codon:yes gene_type:complete
MLIFEDLVFEKTFGGVGATHTFDNGITISVQAGSGNYSTPRENLSSSDNFVSFEVAVWDEDGDFVTKDFVPDINDDVIGWQGRGEISFLMVKIQVEK